MPVPQSWAILQHRCKFNTPFSFKPKWHLTRSSNKSKQFKHKGDRGGRGGLQYPVRDNEAFKLLVL